MPVGRVLRALAKLWFQPANRETAIDRMSLWEYENLEVARLVAAKHGSPCLVRFGINLSDSIDRRIYVQKSGGKNERRRTFYPCLDWPKEMILRTIEESGVRLPADYRLANRSLAGVPNVRHLIAHGDRVPGRFRPGGTLVSIHSRPHGPRSLPHRPPRCSGDGLKRAPLFPVSFRASPPLREVLPSLDSLAKPQSAKKTGPLNQSAIFRASIFPHASPVCGTL